MGNIQFWDNKILFGDSQGNNTDKIAMHEDCCCEEEQPVCETCIGNVTPTFQVVLGAIANEDCGACAALNDIYILPFEQQANPFQCYWRYTFSGPCTMIEVAISVRFGGGFPPALTAWITDEDHFSIRWNKDFVDKVDCADLTDENIPFAGDTTRFCNGASSTCRVTAL